MPLMLLIAVPILALGLWWSLVDRPRGKLVGSWVLRVLAVVLLVLALCQPHARLAGERVHVVFLVDVSASVDLEAAERASEDVERAIEELEAGDSWSLFAMGRGLRAYESPEALREELADWREGVGDDRFRSATQISRALRQARLAMPGDKARRIVLLSDRKPTDGPAEGALAGLSDEGIDVVAGEVAGLAEAEAAVVGVEPSTQQAYEGQMVRLSVRMASNESMGGELRILEGGAVVTRDSVQLEPGAENVARVDVPAHTPGQNVWAAELVPERDHFPVNNRMETTVQVHGQPRVLVIHEDPQQMRDFQRAMQQQQFSVQVRPPRGVPSTMDELLGFDAVLLAKAPATELSTRQMVMLQRYVADYGGGLMMLGSEESFGLGGYYQTPVDEVLPLASRFEQEREQPSVAMVLVIDRSGSMSGQPIALARQAARETVDMLGPRDQIAIIAFDTEAYTISEMRPASEADAIKSAIAGLTSGGGTYMYVGMEAGKQMLEQAQAQLKHMIVLGDGMTIPADHFGLVGEMRDMNVTVSSVALGHEADRPLLSAIAEAGGGRYYETMDPNAVPQIFTRETMRAARSAIKEDVFASLAVSDHPATAGFEDGSLPHTFGYVMTQAQPTAQVLLATDTGDPLLAVSRYGLGTGMAYTSDLTPRWGGQWLGWPQFGQYWAQLLRALVREVDDAGLSVQGEVVDGQWRVQIRRRDEAGLPVSGVSWDAQVLDEQGGVQPVRVAERGLGAYEARIDIADRRRLSLRLHDVEHDKLRAVHHHEPYPLEYRLDGQADEALLGLAAFEPERVRAGLEPVQRREALMPWLVMLAIACLIAGVALRRV